MKNAVLIELNSYHDECLYSQIRFLKDSNYTVMLIINAQIFERAEEYLHLAKHVIIYDHRSVKNFLNKIVWTLKQYLYIKKNGADIVIFNTASSRLEVILLSTLLKRKVKLFGILHNLKKVNHSLSQKLINKAIKKYFVLNDFLENSVLIEDKSIELQSFYPIFFPKYNTVSLLKPRDEIWISIPGKLDFNRRDYDLIVEALVMMNSRENLKFVILGNTNSENLRNSVFLKQLKVNNIHENFILFDYFIENSLFHEYIAKSDYILLPLKSVGDNYSKYKIMGNYNLAFAHKKSLICPKGLEHIDDIHEHSTFYEDGIELSKILKNILDDREIYKTKYDSIKWEFKEQQNKYIGFIESK
nr:hypothetical protein [uncultured Allomuricauda sp.]